jgi:hypothetical protein
MIATVANTTTNSNANIGDESNIPLINLLSQKN